jgi:putative alpha-1,2-mannosidase
LPGNDDDGAMTSWYVWGSMGLYPNAGQVYYYIGAPVFRQTHIRVGEGRSFVINAPKAGAENKYLQSATLNGKPLNRAWLKHSELIMAGGELQLNLGPEPANWAREQRPYSVEAAN